MKVLGITGHRPKTLYGYNDEAPGNIFVIHAMGDFFKQYKPSKVITGMALGTDQWAAQWCIKLGIPFIAAIPFENQDNMWPEESKKKYQRILAKATEKIVVVPNCSPENIKQAMQTRNMWMVDHSDSMLGVFGGSAGGTRNCLEYAKEKEKEIAIINPGDYYKTKT
jgi:uncharacterized phage-like protein YoqJ